MKHGSLFRDVLLLALMFLIFPNAQSQVPDSLYLLFKDPPNAARPFFRWWWNGNRVTREGILRELHVMKSVGAGGVEINPIALSEVYGDPEIKAVPWLSQEWNALVKFTTEEAAKLGLAVDLIVGTGWPFGGDFLSDEETIKGMVAEQIPLYGPDVFKKQILPPDSTHTVQHIRLSSKNVEELDRGIDLTHRVFPDHTLQFQVPPGDHMLSIIYLKNRFREVAFGAPGADGPVLDHFNRAAVEKYLYRMSGALESTFKEKIGKHIRSLFCDSIELEGANWTLDFAEQFFQRRGYRIEPFLPHLLKNDGFVYPQGQKQVLRRIRFDYSLTLGELFMERFIQPFHEWCHANQALSRYQAYGHPWLYTDLLQGYLVPDIPESDQWLFNPGWVRMAEIDQIRYATWNKYASSGANLMQRKIASCEAMTNTSGIFRASLEYVKQATDLNFITGINHLVLHGFNYSPPEAGFPGWIRFGTYFRPENPWWSYAPEWFDYCSRLSAVFQETEPVTQIAILGPTLDMWSDFGLDRNPWITTPKYLHALWQAFNHHGLMADYLNAHVLENASFRDGKLTFGKVSYDLLVLAQVRTVSPKTVDAIARFAANGGKIVFVETLPSEAPGYQNWQKNTALVRKTIESIIKNNPRNIRQFAAPGDQELLEWAGKVMTELSLEPAVRISHPDEKLFFIVRKHKDREVYFFSNMDRKRGLTFQATFPISNKTCWRWDAEDGTERPYLSNLPTDSFPIRLGPLESLLLVFEPPSADATDPWKIPQIERTPLMTMTGPWEVTLDWIDGKQSRVVSNDLIDFANIDSLRGFSGTIFYRTRFEHEQSTDMVLDLGQVHETAELSLNGQPLGSRYWGLRRFECGNFLRRGENVLEIKVTTLLFNYCKSLADNPVATFWAARSKDQSLTPTGLLGPVKLYRKID